jgi:microcystin-dependent protein
VNGNLKVTGTITGNIDATNVNSGVLNIARIPILDITRMVIITGMIVMWSGDEINIPTGWGLCNGQDGRPDLRGRFILGSGQGSGLTNRTKGMTGGVERYALTVAEMPTHNHGITDPGHAHNWTATRQEQGTDDKNYTQELSKGDAGAADTMSKNTNSVTTGISIQNNGSGQAHENMPPFYVLAFIIKL